MAFCFPGNGTDITELESPYRPPPTGLLRCPTGLYGAQWRPHGHPGRGRRRPPPPPGPGGTGGIRGVRGVHGGMRGVRAAPQTQCTCPRPANEQRLASASKTRLPVIPGTLGGPAPQNGHQGSGADAQHPALAGRSDASAYLKKKHLK
eukprot:gene7499-biopygen1511